MGLARAPSLRAPLLAALISLLAGTLCACQEESLILVALGTDYEPGVEIVHVEIGAGAGQSVEDSTTRIDGEDRRVSTGIGEVPNNEIVLPTSFTVRQHPEQRPHLAYVRVEGFARSPPGFDELPRVTAARIAEFRPGRAQRMAVDLCRACEGVRCGPDERCAGGLCHPLDLGESLVEVEPGRELEGFPPHRCPPELISPADGQRTGTLMAPDTLRPRLRWAPVSWPSEYTTAHPVTYEVQLDSGCVSSDCAFEGARIEPSQSTGLEPALTLPNEAPVGARFYWRVRACADAGAGVAPEVRGAYCTEWSRPRYFDAGRTRVDYNGDGYDDLAIGSPHRSSGAVTIRYGAPDGRSGAVVTLSPSEVAATDAGFGVALASDDFDADGFSDLAVGAPRYACPGDREAGAVLIYVGRSDGLFTESPGVVLCGIAGSFGRFGTSVHAVGDLNRDGYADLAVGAPFQSSPQVQEGNVLIYLGGPPGLSDTSSLTLDSPEGIANGHFGDTLGAGDLNGDGQIDLIVGAPDYAAMDPSGSLVGAGAAFVYFGDGQGGFAGEPTALAAATPMPGENFGRSIATGDFDADGATELVISVPRRSGERSQEGVLLYYELQPGARTFLPPVAIPHPGYPDGSRPTAARLGHSLCAGDLDGDGVLDLAAGGPAFGAHGGEAWLFPGGQFPPPAPILVPIEGLEIDAEYGSRVSCSVDHDGDGRIDLLVGAPNQLGTGGLRTGAAYLYTSRPPWSLPAGAPEGLSPPAEAALVDAEEFGASMPP